MPSAETICSKRRNPNIPESVLKQREKMNMQLYDAFEDMFKASGEKATRVSAEVFNSNTIQSSKSRGIVMNAAKVAKIAEYCGYELCLIPEDSVPRNAIPISPDQAKEK